MKLETSCSGEECSELDGHQTGVHISPLQPGGQPTLLVVERGGLTLGNSFESKQKWPARHEVERNSNLSTTLPGEPNSDFHRK